ncbi:NAD(P)-dependent alcohol dehydrogenase [Microbacterium sp. SORGH_AS_0862]|uniref:NAD(P)-dependent alcohol dehydrogenase n=1 Tax=Microbacterium sp. SORGH_AS_0862 TaxID=3041789 RepID=UPI0027902DBC|nr:NAD(P)-dependent alcohol dehydrogenase [Microbacterium sp. SORGH_AS_0862]MDQ1203864.1 putative zinc-type alcohol dehydrogenase-like protein [Microbacterium sp. SORGH_AS_0862]
MSTTAAWQSTGNSVELRKVLIDRRALRADDLAVRVSFCGVCHSDLHAIHGVTPHMSDGSGLVAGHEFTGTVMAVGSAVTGFAVGDVVAVGTLVDSCAECAMCLMGQENFCYLGPVSTYGGKDRIDGTSTKGGYSREYVVRERFAYHLPAGLDPAAAAPLMCAGITMWEPLRAARVGAGSRVAVAGLGGLGHLGVKLAAALGAEVTVLSRTADKTGDAHALGASDLLVTTDAEQMQQARGRFDLILDTISAEHELSSLLRMLDLDGTLSVVGNPLMAAPRILELAAGRKKLTSSGTGGTKGTAEMLAFCAERGIAADVEVLPSSRVIEALNRLEDGDVRYRFVLDMSDLDQPEA